MTDHDDWEPLSESEMKILQARRERSDKISKLMGDYLLKGYKMLATTCPECQTILLRDRQDTDYCVACSELDTDTGKDDPVINQTAAISMAREIELASGSAVMKGASEQSDERSPAPAASGSQQQPQLSVGPSRRASFHPETTETVTSLSMTSVDVQCWPPSSVDLKPTESGNSSTKVLRPVLARQNLVPSSTTVISLQTCDALTAKIDWANKELTKTQNVEYSTQLCLLIKTAAEAITAVRTSRI